MTPDWHAAAMGDIWDDDRPTLRDKCEQEPTLQLTPDGLAWIDRYDAALEASRYGGAA